MNKLVIKQLILPTMVIVVAACGMPAVYGGVTYYLDRAEEYITKAVEEVQIKTDQQLAENWSKTSAAIAEDVSKAANLLAPVLKEDPETVMSEITNLFDNIFIVRGEIENYINKGIITRAEFEKLLNPNTSEREIADLFNKKAQEIGGTLSAKDEFVIKELVKTAQNLKKKLLDYKVQLAPLIKPENVSMWAAFKEKFKNFFSFFFGEEEKVATVAPSEVVTQEVTPWKPSTKTLDQLKQEALTEPLPPLGAGN